jgi:hypothetical protein
VARARSGRFGPVRSRRGGDGPVPGGVGGESERDEAPEVDGSAAVRPVEVVAVDAAVGQSAVSGHEPGQGPFDEGSASVVGVELIGAGLGAGGDEQVVVFVHDDDTPALCRGAPRSQWAGRAVGPEAGASPRGQGDGDLVRTGHGPGAVVDGEVVECEPALDGGP